MKQSITVKYPIVLITDVTLVIRQHRLYQFLSNYSDK